LGGLKVLELKPAIKKGTLTIKAFDKGGECTHERYGAREKLDHFWG